MKYFSPYLLILLLVAGACGNDEVKPAAIGLDYFPLKKGVYQVYNVSEVIYSEVSAPETRSYQLKIEVMDSFPESEHGYRYVMSRTKRDDANTPWTAVDTWSVKSNGRELIVNEGNIAFVKLTFPVREGSEWNGNKFNNGDEDQYEMVNVGEKADFGGTTFEETLKILQEDNEDLIVFQDKREEVYARGAGLVYKETVQLRYCTDPGCIGQQQIKSGQVYKQEIVEYGGQ